MMLRLLVALLVPAALHAQGKTPSVAELQILARADSNDPVAHYNLAAALAKSRRYHDAEQALRVAIRIDPQYAPALMLLAQMNERQSDGPMAVFLSGRRIFFMRMDPKANENALLRRRAFLIDPLLEIDSPDRNLLPVAWRGTLSLALHHYDRRDWAEAMKGFESVIGRTSKPTDSTKVPPIALWFSARCALELGHYDDAMRRLKWLLALRMQDSTAERVWNPFAGEELRYIVAYVQQQARRWDEAVAGYQELLELDLGLDPAHTHLAEIYEAQERWSDAVEERVRAIHANPEGASVIFNLGSTLVSAGRYAEAAPVLERYAAAYPRESRTFYLLGVAYAALGDSSRARASFTQYLTLAPSRYQTQINDATARLAALRPNERRE